MTTDTPNPPPAGPALDRAVAEAIGWSWVTNRFSTHMDAAFAALRATKTGNYHITCSGTVHHVSIEDENDDILVTGESVLTLPEAICRAVLAWAKARAQQEETTDGN